MNLWTIINVITRYAFNVALSALPNPSTTIDGYIDTGLTNFRDLYAYINWIFPVEALFILVLIIITVETFYTQYWLFAKLVKIVSFGFIDL